MKEVVGEYTEKRIGPTFFRGQLPIDGVWATPDITVSNDAGDCSAAVNWVAWSLAIPSVLLSVFAAVFDVQTLWIYAHLLESGLYF